VGLERAHAEFLGQGEGLAVGGCGRLDLREIAMHSDLTEEPECIGLLSTALEVTGARQGMPGQLAGVFQAAC
jgi:hypothetical protein